MSLVTSQTDQRPIPSLSEEMLAFTTELVELVQSIINESGDAHHFDARQWVTEWLSTPVPALGWRKPIEFTAAQDDRELLKALLGRMQSGAYS